MTHEVSFTEQLKEKVLPERILRAQEALRLKEEPLERTNPADDEIRKHFLGEHLTCAVSLMEKAGNVQKTANSVHSPHSTIPVQKPIRFLI